MTEIEYLNQIDVRLQGVFNMAVEARDEAQAAIMLVQSIKADLLVRKIELQKAMLAETKQRG